MQSVIVNEIRGAGIDLWVHMPPLVAVLKFSRLIILTASIYFSYVFLASLFGACCPQDGSCTAVVGFPGLSPLDFLLGCYSQLCVSSVVVAIGHGQAHSLPACYSICGLFPGW